MEKLSKFASNAESDVVAINEVSRLLELEVAFMNFSIKTYPKNINYVN
jgi:hypothetical protein